MKKKAARKKMVWSFDNVLSHFDQKDPKLAAILRENGEFIFYRESDYFVALVRAIIGQQVSVKAAQSIFEKFHNGLKGCVEPNVVAACTPEQLRAYGLSPQKQGYITDLARHFVDDPNRFAHLDKFSDDEVLEALISVKGIGKWTAQMFLMFTLGRVDVFAPDDLGIRNAMIKLYGWKSIPNKMKMEKKAKAWSPYRTIACRYLWISLSNAPK